MLSPGFPKLFDLPLVPLALGWTAGVVADRHADLPAAAGLAAAGLALLVWCRGAVTGGRAAHLVFLAAAAAGLGAAWHGAARSGPADGPGAAGLVRLRGVLCDQPEYGGEPGPDPLRTFPPREVSRAVVRVTSVEGGGRWRPARGRAALTAGGDLRGLRAGDEVEVFGRLVPPGRPGNPGEFDHAGRLRDAGVDAVVAVDRPADAVTLLRPGGLTWRRLVAHARAWCGGVIAESLPPGQRDLARALLLGEQSALDRDDWDRFQRTGVVHVLAISGQHLVVLVGLFAAVAQVFAVPLRRRSWFVPVFVCCYAALTGGRPPVVRAAVMVVVLCLGVLLRRPVRAANVLALAWLAVTAWDPSAVFHTGCQLSFLAVAVLMWFGERLRQRGRPDGVEQLRDERRPLWLRLLRRSGFWLLVVYVTTLAVWLCLAPLIAARFHLVSPAAVLIGPPVMLLSSLALLAGFLMLLSAAALPLLVPVFAAVTAGCLSGCNGVIDFALSWPFSYMYVPGPPDWWLWGFYLVLLPALLVPRLGPYWARFGLALVGWVCLGLAVDLLRPRAEGLHCTFLSVGHGSCVVLETPDGRTLLYDAGALAGPEVTRRQIAPYLWHRRVRRIDEVFLSHADLDHFNGLPSLLERFAVGRVTTTRTFALRDGAGVQLTVRRLAEAGVPVRHVKAGDRLAAGGVAFQVLHPQVGAIYAEENARSLVLLVEHGGHTVLLTGDLERDGLAAFLRLPPTPVDVLMAPHHGSKSANTAALAAWARPKVVVSCQGEPKFASGWEDPYQAVGAKYLTTWEHGAVTVRSHADGLSVATYRTGEQWRVE